MDPPQCVQNAMMTKDKKPFTYTPGGIDLSEVRSPRMQRRIERNANLGGVADTPRPPPPPQNVGPLPPAALAAMRPQTQVQVFPGPPPPPPMQKNVPPPPPPPSGPLPTQKVTTGDNQVLERPDMTKIIPENPMALLRRTGGPAPRKSVVDQMFEEQARSPPSPPQRNFEAQSPRYPQGVAPAPAPASPPVQQQRPQPQPQVYQPQPQPQPQPQYPPAQPQQHQQQQPSGYQPPVIERQPPSSNVGTLYIPPLGQQQQKVVPPQTPPERTHHHQQQQQQQQQQVQSPPGTPPTLKEAPRPWQQKSSQQEELPPWARRDQVPPPEVPATQSPPSVPNMQQRWQAQPSQAPPPQPVRSPASSQQFSPRPQPQQQPSMRVPPSQNQTFPVHIEIRTGPSYEPAGGAVAGRNPEAVYVTQPVVLQHPGTTIEPPYKVVGQQQQYQQPRQQPVVAQQQQPKVDSSGARIIPIQIEGRTTPSAAPGGGERNLSRQLSWGSQPSQSNSFKVIQKMTKTDDDEDDDTPLTHHSPRYTQEMPEQVRRIKNNGHFREVPQNNLVGSRMVQEAQAGDGQPQRYVHPSEQVVPEPKKYMGSNIPSRSFKILQAMTAPIDNCANANNNNEEIQQQPQFHPVYNPYSYPYYPPPYWSEYYPNYYPPEQSEPGNYPQEPSDSTSKMSGRSTPVPMPPPYWGYMPPPPPHHIPPYARPKCQEEMNQYPPMYPPYFDPYYYGYYYGYYPPYYSPTTETSSEDYPGYSSMDEMSSYNSSGKSRRNSLDNNSVQALRQQFELRSKSAAPRITITSTATTDVDDDKVEEPPQGLRSIKSVQNVHVYMEDDGDGESEDESSDEATDEDELSVDEDGEETIPHQLSVIYEESERGDSRRCNSVASESTTIAEEHYDDDDDEDDVEQEDAEDFLSSQDVQYKIKLFQEVKDDEARRISKEEIKTRNDGDDEDWWGKLEDAGSIKESEQVCDKGNPKADSVMVEVGQETFCVKLRNKAGRQQNDLVAKQEHADDDAVHEDGDDDAFFSTASQRSSVYDILKNPDEDADKEEESGSASGGILMRVDSFASQLEAIKRHSGLWNQDGVIKEESSDDSETIIDVDKPAPAANDDEGEDVDFWSQIKNDDEDDDFTPRRRSCFLDNDVVVDVVEEHDSPDSRHHSSCSQSHEDVPNESDEEESDTTTDSSEEEEEDNNNIPPPQQQQQQQQQQQTIKDRIEALKNSISQKQHHKDQEEVVVVLNINPTSTRSSTKSFEDYSEEEEELDSGVISDISRHISDNEDFPELKKLTRYERAATHSRLFKLLQDECCGDTEDEANKLKEDKDKFSKLSVRQSRSKLNLTLTKCNQTDDEKGTHINEKLVGELVQSLLRSKKAHNFKNMPREKLYAAAAAILQEGLHGDSPPEEFSSLLSPLRGDTQSSTPAQTPQEFYNEYSEYYNSWSEAALDIVPSKAFKLLQEHLAKCPRVLSSREIHKLLEEPGSDCPNPLASSPQSNDVANT